MNQQFDRLFSLTLFIFIFCLGSNNFAWADRGPAVENIVEYDLNKKNQLQQRDPASTKGVDFEENSLQQQSDLTLIKNIFIIFFLLAAPLSISFLIINRKGDHENKLVILSEKNSQDELNNVVPFKEKEQPLGSTSEPSDTKKSTSKVS